MFKDTEAEAKPADSKPAEEMFLRKLHNSNLMPTPAELVIRARRDISC